MARSVLAFAGRHSWILFLAIGALHVWFGWTDIGEAKIYVDSVAAMSLLVIGVLTTTISVTALQRGERWAWITMLIWPVFGVSFAIFGWTRPGVAVFGIIHTVVPGVALLLSAPRRADPLLNPIWLARVRRQTHLTRRPSAAKRIMWAWPL